MVSLRDTMKEEFTERSDVKSIEETETKVEKELSQI